jgi:hypothetical protein
MSLRAALMPALIPEYAKPRGVLTLSLRQAETRCR